MLVDIGISTQAWFRASLPALPALSLPDWGWGEW